VHTKKDGKDSKSDRDRRCWRHENDQWCKAISIPDGKGRRLKDRRKRGIYESISGTGRGQNKRKRKVGSARCKDGMLVGRKKGEMKGCGVSSRGLLALGVLERAESGFIYMRKYREESKINPEPRKNKTGSGKQKERRESDEGRPENRMTET
jgi:hypothetical protein